MKRSKILREKIVFSNLFINKFWHPYKLKPGNYTRYERMLLASTDLLGNLVTLITLGKWTYSGYIFAGLKLSRISRFVPRKKVKHEQKQSFVRVPTDK